jgi:transposase-like protein
MIEYPMDLIEFENEFRTEDQCRAYIIKLRYKEGTFTCPLCGSKRSYPVKNNFYECAQCGHQESILSGTLFQDTHKPLPLWFRAIWYIASQKNGTSALGLQRVLGLGSYKTAWLWLHKLRRAMVSPGRDKLSGKVEVDEASFGGPETGGKRGRGAENKVLAAIAVEINEGKVGRMRIAVIRDLSSTSLHRFIEDTVEQGSIIITDGWRGYNGISVKGYRHEAIAVGEQDVVLPHIHTIISLIKRWILGTLQGSCSKEHLAYYFDEFAFRFNRRKSNSRGLLFYRLLQNAVRLEPITYEMIVAH